MNTLEDQMNDRKKKLQSRLKVLQDSKEKKDETIIQHDLEEINRLKLLQKVDPNFFLSFIQLSFIDLFDLFISYDNRDMMIL